MCGGGNPVSKAFNEVNNFAPLQQPIQQVFGTNDKTDAIAGAVLGPSMSGQINQSGDIQPNTYLYNRIQNQGLGDALPVAQMFGKAVAGGFAGGAANGAGDTSGFVGNETAAGGAGVDTLGTGAPAAGTDSNFVGDLPTDPNAGAGPQMPPAQAVDPATLQAMGLQQVGPGQYTQGGMPIFNFNQPAVTPNQVITPQQQMPPAQQPAQPGQPAASGQSPAQDPNAVQQQQPGGPQQQAPQGANQPPQQQGMVEKILESMKNNPLGTASVAMLGANALSAKKAQQGGGPGGQAMQQQQQISAQAQQQAQQLLSQYQSGTLSAGQQAQLDQLSQNTKNQLRQYFASIGQSDSTAAVQSLAQVDAQAAQMKQQMLDNALTQGLSALGIASGPLNSVANYQLGQDKQLRDAFGNFATQVGTIFGRQSGQTQQQNSTATNQTTSQPTQMVSSTDPNNPSPP